ncbi:MAG: hypothetical protein ACO323_06800, partial [Candidatus Kapaibacteriota bacterium]
MRLLIGIVCIIFLLGCETQNNEKKNDLQAHPILKDSVQKKKDTIPISSELPRGLDTTIDESSRFIAGLPLASNRLRGIASYGFYGVHTKRLQELFRRVKTKRLKPMSDFSQSELSTDKVGDGTLFYPFSGPDALHAVTLFPNYKQYVFIAFEPPGSFKKFSSRDTTGVPDYLQSVQININEVTNYSYFITDKMRKFITADKVDGALPLIGLFLVHTDHTLIGHGKRYLHADGTINTQSRDTSKVPVQEVHDIYFTKNGSTYIQRLTYIYANLGNAAYAGKIGFTNNIPLRNFLNSMKGFNTYVKSASYLMHNAGFSEIRNFLLSNANTVFQDDTGIPFENYDQRNWDFVFYGRYARPINLFAKRYSPALDSAYSNPEFTKRPLPFMSGYLLRRGDAQNIYKAIRKSAR